MVIVGILIVGLSIAAIAYGLYFRRLNSTDEVAGEVYHRVMRGDHFGKSHMKPAYDVVNLMLFREDRSKKCLIGGIIGLIIGGLIIAIGLIV